MAQGYRDNEDAADGGGGGFVHRIREGMEVVSDAGAHIGTVTGIKGDEILLDREASSAGGQEFVLLSLVATVAGGRVIMRERGDNSFGEEAAH